jgi:hypothetical protein
MPLAGIQADSDWTAEKDLGVTLGSHRDLSTSIDERKLTHQYLNFGNYGSVRDDWKE